MANNWRNAPNKFRKRDSASKTRDQSAEKKLPRNAPDIDCVITQLGARGDGIAEAEMVLDYQPQTVRLFVPDSLPHETLKVKPTSRTSDGVRADIIELITKSPDRKEPSCDVFPACGGCQFQHMASDAYRGWKEGALSEVLERGGISPTQRRPTIWTGPGSRRRVTLSFRRTADTFVLGFLGRASQFIQPASSCTIMLPELSKVALLLQGWGLHLPAGSNGQCQLNLLDSGVDILVLPQEKLAHDVLSTLAHETAMVGCQRLSVLQPGDDDPYLIYAGGAAVLRWGGLSLSPPSGAFLQSTLIGEAALQDAVADCVKEARSIADIFCGSGTLSAPLLNKGKTVLAADNASSVTHFQQAANKAGYGHEVTFVRRNLFDAPLRADELAGIDCAIIDPPRAGAWAQIAEIVKARLPVIAMISCNPHSFFRDAQQLLAAGYVCDWLQMIDQFHLTPHTELVARFSHDAGTAA